MLITISLVRQDPGFKSQFDPEIFFSLPFTFNRLFNCILLIFTCLADQLFWSSVPIKDGVLEVGGQGKASSQAA